MDAHELSSLDFINERKAVPLEQQEFTMHFDGDTLAVGDTIHSPIYGDGKVLKIQRMSLSDERDVVVKGVAVYESI